MEIVKIIFYLVAGGVVLSWGADQFVHSASHIARRFGIPSIVIGLTIVAFGTSAPELAVNVLAALKGNPGISMGNVVGSNIFNIAVILGISSMILPLSVNMQLLKIDIPIMFMVSMLAWVMARDGMISRIEALFLFTGLVFYIFLQVKLAIQEKQKVKDEFETEFSEKGTPWKNALLFLAGLVALVGGANLFVEGAVAGARLLGWSEAVIGLTIIAAGTSLPEVATSVAATLKGEKDIAIGNVVGSNIFNILAVLGASGTISTLPVEKHMADVDMSIMVIITAFIVPLAWKRKHIEKPAGIFLLISWIAYTTYLIMNAQVA